MRASDIRIRGIYNVIFDPVRNCEFNGRHLAVVLKKNNDKASFIVMPLTSASNGEGINKAYIGRIVSLPTSLKNNPTYAVFNQVRTVHASRFISLKEGGKVIEVLMPDSVFQTLLMLAIQELVYNVAQDEKVELLRIVYMKACVAKAKELAYRILAMEQKGLSAEDIHRLEAQIKEILLRLPCSMEETEETYVEPNILMIFRRALKMNSC